MLLLVAAALAPLTGGASAQNTPMGGPLHHRVQETTPEEQRQQKQIDNDYKAATKIIPDQKPKDPWADVRPTTAAPASKNKQ